MLPILSTLTLVQTILTVAFLAQGLFGTGPSRLTTTPSRSVVSSEGSDCILLALLIPGREDDQPAAPLKGYQVYQLISSPMFYPPLNRG